MLSWSHLYLLIIIAHKLVQALIFRSFPGYSMEVLVVVEMLSWSHCSPQEKCTNCGACKYRWILDHFLARFEMVYMLLLVVVHCSMHNYSVPCVYLLLFWASFILLLLVCMYVQALYLAAACNICVRTYTSIAERMYVSPVTRSLTPP